MLFMLSCFNIYLISIINNSNTFPIKSSNLKLKCCCIHFSDYLLLYSLSSANVFFITAQSLLQIKLLSKLCALAVAQLNWIVHAKVFFHNLLASFCKMIELTTISFSKVPESMDVSSLSESGLKICRGSKHLDSLWHARRRLKTGT